MEKNNDLGVWKCLSCGDTAGVVNGVCPTDGPCQTQPIDEVAQGIAGVKEAATEQEAQAQPSNSTEVV